MRHLVVGTAGHIDHGKSALVRALTGIDPDRLAEEKRRGITIELGFADLDLGAGRTLSFVDVPGHERFVRHMVAGATGIEAVLLVVAADRGVERQTREHLAICELLAVRRGVLALTKCDLVDDELREVVALELRERVAGTFLADAPLVAVSARDGRGLGELRQALTALFDAPAGRRADGPARLPVDRSFVMHGFGTVVTGTLVAGALREGQEVEVLPGGARGRIRGIQVHGRSAAGAAAGGRAAVNLQGLACAQVPRGSTLTEPGALAPSGRAWVRLALLEGAPRRLRDRGGPVRFHLGTADVAGRLRVLGADGSGAVHAELRLETAAVLAPGDRFVLRRPAPVDTVGGGVVVDAHPPPSGAYDPAAFAEGATAPERLVARALQRASESGVDAAVLGPRLGLSAARVDDVLQSLASDGLAVAAGGRWFFRDVWESAVRRCVGELDAFHARQPLADGVDRERLRAGVAARLPQESWRGLLELLAARGELRLEGERVARREHRVVLAGGDLELARGIERRLLDAGLDPPSPDALIADRADPRARAVLEQLVARGTLVRIQDGRLFHTAPLEELRRKLRDHARTSPEIDVASFKKLAGVTRKNAIPLLEQLDSERTTRRVGNVREILPERGG